jgi:uncharacterized membrane protein YozB (DUF420 family)
VAVQAQHVQALLLLLLLLQHILLSRLQLPLLLQHLLLAALHYQHRQRQTACHLQKEQQLPRSQEGQDQS